MRKGALIVLYLLVVALVTAPPIFAALLSSMCMNPTGGRCRSVTADDWLSDELAGIWMPPFALAIVLVGVIVMLHRRGNG